MVGPGTGVAAFHALTERRFLHVLQRRADAALRGDRDNGPTGLGYARLLFGCRSSKGDWYYRSFFEWCVAEKALTHYDAVFSRDHLYAALKQQQQQQQQQDSENQSKQAENTGNGMSNGEEAKANASSTSTSASTSPSSSSTSSSSTPGETASAPKLERYVQHIMLRPDTARSIYKAVVEQDGVFIVAGNAKQMPKDVNAAFRAIVQALHPKALAGALPQHSSIGASSPSIDWDNAELERGINELEASQVVTALVNKGRYLVECWY